MLRLLRRYTLRTRLLASMAVLAAALLGLGAWGVVENRIVTQRTAALFDSAQEGSDAVARLRESLANLRRLQADAIASGSNPVEVERLVGLWKSEAERVKKLDADLMKIDSDNTTIEALVKQQLAQLEQYTGIVGPLLDKLQSAVLDSAGALAYAESAEEHVVALRTTADAMLKASQSRQAQIRGELADASALAANLRLGLTVLAVAVLLPALWLTLRSVCEPLQTAVAAADRIARGDLGEDLATEGQDETAALLRSLQQMQLALRRLVGQVRESAESIQTASGEVAAGNADLSQRTEEQASNLQQTASSMEMLTDSVRHNADSAQRANELASDAAGAAAQGGKVVGQAVTTMHDIAASSQKIAEIISVIDGIAFQTNILALNAAVEAARAGEQGRGFAVVAGEVRSLAQRSAEAAREIKTLITASVERVESGTRQVSDAGQAMQEIVGKVARVSQLIHDISGATTAQSRDIGQVGDAVGQLDRVTQQNAALVEQSAAAAASLRAQASRLAEVVGVFRV
ncbi:methyl-accepting chemotaxis protein [Rubrivivax gelatinosus]|uniref:methyl-accepting chemotaxis protein n=1 Tax=Rubrivivax gelatinosus TaxID=28068 RepID=UPI001A2FC531|nr:methyl-accepting chemotaxis protein [Rubrivivax gelatinosus]MBG6082154.1 methyl-accepting chemotaxis protein [Rubrivivax gelatinosus]